MTAKYPWFKMFPSDWLGSTTIACMSAEEYRGYHLLLCHLWQSPGCVLPADVELLSRLAKTDWTASARLRACFVAVNDDAITNAKLKALYDRWNVEPSRARARDHARDRPRDRARAGERDAPRARPRPRSSEDTPLQELHPPKVLPLFQESALPSSQSDDERANGEADRLDFGFEAFWTKYPKLRRKVKQAARTAYVRALARLLKGGITTRRIAAEYLLERLTAYVASEEAIEEKGVPYPQKWLNQERYQEDPSTWVALDAVDKAPRPQPAAPLFNPRSRSRLAAAEAELAKDRPR